MVVEGRGDRQQKIVNLGDLPIIELQYRYFVNGFSMNLYHFEEFFSEDQVQ